MSTPSNHQISPYVIIENRSEQARVSYSNGQSIPKESSKLDHHMQNSYIVTRFFYRFSQAIQVRLIVFLSDLTQVS